MRDKAYVGESTQPVEVQRINEHLGDAHLRKSHTSPGDHMLEYNFNLDKTQTNKPFSIKLPDTGRELTLKLKIHCTSQTLAQYHDKLLASHKIRSTGRLSNLSLLVIYSLPTS